MKKYWISIFFVAFVYNELKAQLSVTASNNAQALAENLVGAGVAISNATLTCASNGAGLFDGSNSNIGLNGGVLLTTGTVQNAIGPNTAPDISSIGSMSAFIDLDLQSLLPQYTLFDGCVLEFDVVPLGNSLSFQYVFGSDEYPEYTCGDYNDIFAFFISGPGIVGKKNIALIPGTNIPVAINSVNSGQRGNMCGPFPFFCTCTSLAYSNYYIANNGGLTIEYDAFTTMLTATANVTPCATYRLKLAIADVGDQVYDSGVFLKEGSLNSNIPSVTLASEEAYRGCEDAFIDFSIPSVLATNIVVRYVIGGSAVSGSDYVAFADSVIIPAGQTTTRLYIETIEDTLNFDPETIELYLYTFLCDTLFYDTVVVTLIAGSPDLIAPDQDACSGETVQLQSTGALSYQWFPANAVSNPNIANPIFLLDSTTTLILRATDINGCLGRKFVTVTINEPPQLLYTPVYNVCEGESVQLSVSGGNTYQWNNAASLNNANISNPVATPLATTTYTVTVSNGCVDTAQITVNVLPPPIADAGNDTSVCGGSSVTLNGSGGVNYSWLGSDGTTYNTANPTVIVNTDVTYYLTVSTGNGCSDTDTVQLSVAPTPVISVSDDIQICAGDSATLSASGANNYLWSPMENIIGENTANPTVFPITEKIYTVTAFNATGCSVTENVTVSVFITSAVEAGINYQVCNGDSGVSIGGHPTAASGADIIWSASDDNHAVISSPYSPNPFINTSGLLPGTYIFEVAVTEQGCYAGTDIMIISVYDFPVVDFSGLDSLYCLEHPADLLIGIPPGGTYSGIGIINNSFYPEAAGLGNNFVITYSYTDPNGCVAEISYQTSVTEYVVSAGEDQTVFYPNSIQLNASEYAASYQWYPEESLSCSDCMNPFASPSATTTYTLVAYSNEGCRAEDNVLVEVLYDTQFWIPNAFTPNADDNNDVFKVYGKNIKTLDMKIFNRWGELIFESDNPDIGWDGTYKGAMQAPGVYVYTVSVTFINDSPSKTQKGSVMLLK